MSSTSTPRRPDIACPILIVGAITYVFLCLPAIGRRGYPPIDPVWLGVTHLWIAPVCLSALFDSFSFRSRRNQLVVYSLVTAFFNAGTFHIVTPRHVSLPGMLALTVVTYGPMHLIGAFGADALMQLLLRPARTLGDAPNEPLGAPRIPLLAWIVGFSIICITIGFPFAFRSLLIEFERAQGVARADEQWDAGEAVVFGGVEIATIGDAYVDVEYHVDPDTGLTWRPFMSDIGFRDAYNARVRELIKIHGEPGWSLKKYVPTAEDVVALFDSTELEEIDSFPHEFTSSFVLKRSDNGSLTIETERSSMTVGDGTYPVHVRIADPIVVIRNGKKWVGVFHKDGRMIASASRF